MLKKKLNMILTLCIYAILLAILIFGIPRLISAIVSRGRIYQVSAVLPSRAAIVFGAGLLRDGTPSPVLKDRVTTAVQLYQAGKVEKILMSGDNRFVDYNEPAAMMQYAVSMGVPEEDIVLDYAGRRTYDTCYRAKEIFGLHEAILVTQRYHLPRALFTCQGMGITVNGVAADLREYHTHAMRFWSLRELPATLVAVWQVWVSHPLPVLGNPEPIFTNSNSNR
jgi:SanA protein